MLALLAAFICLSFADLTAIYNNGQFNSDLVQPELVQLETEQYIRFSFIKARCISVVDVELSQSASAIVETINGHVNGEYKWIEIASSEEATIHSIPVSGDFACASRFRVRATKGSIVSLNLVSEIAPDARTKRAIACADPGAWPTECASASDGAYCITNSCGCKVDADCYSGTAYPFCDGSICNYCTSANGDGNQKANPQNHYFCRSRYPSIYRANGNLGQNSPVTNTVTGPTPLPLSESVATQNFYREVCVSTANAEGTCERCNQANPSNFIAGQYAFPTYSGLTGPQVNSRSGTFFCNIIRGAGSAKPGRPLCMDRNMWAEYGVPRAELVNYKVTMEIANYGTLNGNTVDGGVNVNVDQSMEKWEGACYPCKVKGPNGDLRAHGFCFEALPTTPICDAVTNNCVKCATNADCGLSTDPKAQASCKTDKSLSCTGGANCMADGRCKTCLSDNDCGLADGGEKGAQLTCNVATGICEDKALCDRNFGEAGGVLACGALTPNCNVGGSCIKCLTNADCGTTDGGTTPGQQVCDVLSGICVRCTLNSDCTGTSGANCMADGSCKDCTTSATICTAGQDGGEPAAGPGNCVGTSGFCPDKKDQTICNTATRRCESPCSSNTFCADKAGTGPTSGANCQLNGLCRDCQTPGSASTVANSPNCGAGVDGPQAGLPNFSGVAAQPDCSTSGICVDAFKCTDNASCAGKSGVSCSAGTPCSNCQADQTCLPCIVQYSSAVAFSTTCGTSDGGTTPGQPNCEQSTRTCVKACNNNNDCAGTQGANCMSNGVCFDCRTDADCTSTNGNSWGGDRNAGDILCNAATKICEPGCTSNNNCPANQNCNKDGRCAACATNADCTTNDGPAPMGTNTVCRNGVCIDPYQCVADANDNNNCKALGAGNNCQADKSCLTCTTNAQCGNLDGGIKPRQPICNTATGVCRDCASNAECGGINCNADGTCADCRLFPAGTVCNKVDGPPGTNHINQNCDPNTGACVDFCVSDANCGDACAPKCNLDRGCCVECLTSAHCPVAQWRGPATAYTFCSHDFTCTLPPPGCSYDTECPAGTPACSPTQKICVQCIFDAHCATGSVCETASQRCVACTHDHHCDNNRVCDTRDNVCVVDSPASTMVVSVFALVVALFASLM